MLAASALAACSPSQPASAQKPADAAKPITWTIAPVSGLPGVGKTVNVRIDAKLQGGWHIYSITQPAGGPIATRITLPAGQPFTLASAPKPTVQPEIKFDEAFRMNVQLHAKAVGFTVPVRLARATPAPDSIRVNVRYQVCNASLCYPPQTAKLAAPVSSKAR